MPKKVTVDLDLMKKYRSDGMKIKVAANLLGVSTNTLIRRGWAKLPFNPQTLHTYKKDLHYFEEVNTSDKAYILGFTLADGSIGLRGDIRWELQARDISVLEFIKSKICPSKTIKQYERKDSRFCLLSIKYLGYISQLEKWGVVHRKTYKRQEIPSLGASLIPDFIRGYFDGNGCIWFGKNNRRICGFTGELNLMYEIRDLLFEEGILKMKNKVIDKPHQLDACFSFGDQEVVDRFYNFLYSNGGFSLTRKKHKFNQKTM